MSPAPSPSTRSLIAAIVVGCASVSARGGDVAPGNAGNAGSATTIRVRPAVVYAGGVATVALESRDGASLANIEWTSTAGLLLSDDIPQVEWKAPPRAGRALLRATGARDQEKFQAAVEIDARPPSTDGMVWVPPGKFVRGDIHGTKNSTEVKTIQNACDEPYDSVYLDGFWIDRYPVTNRRYVRFLEECLAQGLIRPGGIAVMGELEGSWVPFYYFQSYEKLVPHHHEIRNPRKPEFLHVISFDGSRFHIKEGREDCSVVDVSWFGAAAFARFYGKRLPSEAQWEKSARGTDGRRFTWGDELPTPYHGPSDYGQAPEPKPIGYYGQISESPYGVSDMLSTCFEWTNDWFNATYYLDYKTDAPARNPTGPFWGSAHTIRGLPYGLQFPQVASDGTEPVSNRYSWFFEFEIGDTFGNRSTTFRTVIPPQSSPPASTACALPVASHE